MLKIRMQRTGRTNMPTFRIVVTEHTRGPKSANFVEKVGSYNPKTKERSLNTERIKYWLSVGARATGTMHNILVSAGIVEGKKVNVLPRKSPPAKEGEQKTENPEVQQADNGAGSEQKTQEPAAETAAEEPKTDAPAEATTPAEQSVEAKTE